ncbi:MAG: hypothetical protein ABIH23_00245 [bacterium]
MSVYTSERGDVLLVYLKDRVSMEDTLEFGQVMKDAIEEEWRKIVVAVASKVINSYCLGTLFASYREACDRGKLLCVVCDQPESRGSIRRFDPQKRLPLYHILEEALVEE